MTASVLALDRQLSHAATFVESGDLAGVHLEGPWLSPLRAGAHPPGLLRPPEQAEVRRLLEAGRGTVRTVTLAPELEGGIEAVRVIVDHGAVAALGHTDAEYAVAGAALDAGASQGTHLGNGMRPVHHREPGVVLALMERDSVVLELINDGVHLHDAVTSALIRSAGSHRVALISDAIPASGLPDGTYRLADDDVSGPRTRGASTAQRLVAGSTHVPRGESPARALQLPDVGRLEAGAMADLVVMDDDLRVAAVMHRGGWLTR